MKKKNHKIQKDLKRRKAVQKYENQRISLKAIQSHQAFSIEKRFLALTQLAKLKKNGSAVRVRNRCVLTGRPRGVHSFFKMSRIKIKDLAAKGLLPGVRRDS